MGNGQRVLICEDDSAIRGLLDKLLSRHGLAVDSVPTGSEAIDRIRRRTYDLILLDLLTPHVSGYEVLDLLWRERAELLDRIIVVTACQIASAGALPVKVAAVLRKPFDLLEFDAIVDSVLSREEVRA
jgi:DNA-binding response OmpR family regulator